LSEDIKKLTESNQFLSSLFNNMETAVFLADRETRVKNINKSFTKLFHKSEDEVYNELCGNAIGCIFPVREESECGKTYHCETCEIRNSIEQCFKDKNKVKREIIKREILIDNEPILKYFYMIANYFKYKNNEYVLVMINDITELQTAKRKLQDLNDIKNEFLGMAAHDLKNPISIISMASKILLEDTEMFTNKENVKLLEMIQNSTNYMTKLIDNLLDVSKIEKGKLILNKSEMNYEKFVEEILELNKISAMNRMINIKLEIDKNISPIISFDQNRIRQVINNLMDNAIKYSPDGSKIIVWIKKRNKKEIITEIKDFGPGIPENELPKLFNEYQITSIKSKNGIKGSGLGLAISKKIIEKHNGEIGVKSQLGKGSTFYFTLPIN